MFECEQIKSFLIGMNRNRIDKICQEIAHNMRVLKTLHPLLVCDIEPDVRPFVWTEPTTKTRRKLVRRIVRKK